MHAMHFIGWSGTRFVCAGDRRACRPPGGDRGAQRRSHICNGAACRRLLLRGGTALVYLRSPDEAKRIEACFSLCGHTVLPHALNTNPLPQSISLSSNVFCWHPAVPIFPPECLQLLKTFFPLSGKHTPDKTMRIEAFLAVCRHTVFGGALSIGPWSRSAHGLSQTFAAA